MKEITINRTIRCPKEQIIEKEIYGDTVKQRVKNWPLDLDKWKECEYHGGINQYRDGRPPKVVCRHDEAPLRADIKTLKEAQEIMEKYWGDPTAIQSVLDSIRSSEQKVSESG